MRDIREQRMRMRTHNLKASSTRMHSPRDRGKQHIPSGAKRLALGSYGKLDIVLHAVSISANNFTRTLRRMERTSLCVEIESVSVSEDIA